MEGANPYLVHEMVRAQKSKSTAILLALFLGGLGAHHFYLGKYWLGILYLLFFWTFIPAIIALFECFFLGSRVDEYNRKKFIEYKMYYETMK